MPKLVEVLPPKKPRLAPTVDRVRPGAKVDDRAILALLSEGLPGREVARLTGVSQITVYTVARFYRGQCNYCGKPVDAGHTNCAECRAKLAAAQKKERDDLKHRGLCVVCKEPHCVSSKLYCEKHLAECRAANAGRYVKERTKRGAPNQGIPSTTQRERAIRERYGEGALEVWRRSEARCQLCGVSYREKALHMHHLDGNYENRAAENFACLCLRCHQLVHHVVEHPRRTAALRWIVERYPES